MNAVKNVTIIPATLNYYSAAPITRSLRKKVAAYARVSTDKDEQLTSYEMQVRYYTNYICSNPDWDFIKVYADEGITGTSTKKRDEFNDMVKDALAGKIDMIITKSVARFARNTVDSLITVRKLREKGVSVYFENEGIDTLDSKGELLLTIMSSIAQEGARKISEDVTWGHRKRFQEGKVLIPYGNFLGYKKGEDGLPKIIEEEAKIVKLIYKLFLDGKTPYGISEHLSKKKIASPMGRDRWNITTINSILTNEKYKGEAILQKSFTVDYLTKKKKQNQGEVPKYHVKDSHQAIIESEVFEMVQVEIKKRKKLRGQHSGNCVFSSKIICADCNNFYGSKLWHSTDKYRSIVWQCGHKFKGKKKCITPHFREEQLKKLFILAFNKLLENKDEIIKNCKSVLELTDGTTSLETERARLYGESKLLITKIQNYVNKNASETLDQEDYKENYSKLSEEYERVSKKIQDIESKLQMSEVSRIALEKFLKDFSENTELIDSFDDKLFRNVVDKVIIDTNCKAVFIFKNEEEIDVGLHLLKDKKLLEDIRIACEDKDLYFKKGGTRK